eukprot:6033354-Amphidinium_carterae.5
MCEGMVGMQWRTLLAVSRRMRSWCTQLSPVRFHTLPVICTWIFSPGKACRAVFCTPDFSIFSICNRADL